MKRTLKGIVTLGVVAGCGGLAALTGQDAGTDRGSTSPVDSGPMAVDSGPKDAPLVDAHDAPGDVEGGTPTALCPGAHVHADANGNPWSTYSFASVDGGSNATFNAIWGSGPSDVWTVGGWGSLGEVGIIAHWDGTAWSLPALPPIANVAQFFGVWGSGPSDVWAMGDYILHWDGSTWSASTAPVGDAYSGAWGSGPDDVWAVGYSTILHWDGGAWSNYIPENLFQGFLAGVWGSGPCDVWTVGVGEIAEVLHWDGSLLEKLHGVHVPEWSLYTIPDYSWGGIFSAVWGSGAGDVWIAGQGAMFHHS
jgi:hypothetical protein